MNREKKSYQRWL